LQRNDAMCRFRKSLFDRIVGPRQIIRFWGWVDGL
jgi:hypothetical protein